MDNPKTEVFITLGEMLRWHRAHCRRCNLEYACPEYREIATEYREETP